MSKEFSSSFQIGLLMVSGIAMATPLPESIIKQLPNDYSVISYQSGELNDDSLIDFIVAIRKNDEESIAKEGRAPARPLMLFIQNSDRSYTMARRNDHVVFKISEGGQCDPFEDGVDGLVINKRYFTVQNSVACGQHWTDYITFRYAPELRDWVFHNRIFENWVINNGSTPNEEALVAGRRRVVSGKGKPSIRFESYRAN